jgi:D12 class N6 adenine-specific DNA methyltransferase
MLHGSSVRPKPLSPFRKAGARCWALTLSKRRRLLQSGKVGSGPKGYSRGESRTCLLPTAQPFLRWAGSKRKLLPKLLPYWGQGHKRYIEPFAGSSALFFRNST